MTTFRFISSLALVLGFLALAISALATAQGPGGLYGETLVVAVVGALDPNPLNRSPANGPLHDLLYDSLGRASPTTLVPEPWLAESWDVNVSARTVTAHLRASAKWADGTALGADDVVTSYERYRTAGIVSGFTATYLDPTTVVFGFAQSGGDFLGKWITLPIAFDSPTGPARASGVFEPGLSVPGISLEILANEDHWRGRPYVDAILYEFHTGPYALDDAACDLIAKRADFLGVALTVNDLTNPREDRGPPIPVPCGSIQQEGIFIASDPGFLFLHLGMNTARPPLSDPGFRVALSSALDRELVRTIEPSTSIADSVVTAANSFWFNASVPQYRVEKGVEGGRVVTILDNVNDMLDRAGYLDRTGDGWRDNPDGTPFALTFLHLNATLDPRIAKVQSISTNLNAVGIRLVEFEPSPQGILARVLADDFDIFLGTFEVESDPSFLFDLFHSSRIAAGRNYGNLAEPGLDGMLVALRDELHLATRQGIARDVQGWLGETAAAAPLVHFETAYAYNPERFEGWVRQPGGVNNFWSFAGLHVIPQGPLSITVAPNTNSLLSGGTVTVIVTVWDANGIPVQDADVTLTGGSLSPASGATDANGRFVSTFSAPAVTETTEVSLRATATKPGYDSVTGTAGITVHEFVPRLEVSVGRDEAVLQPGESTNVTVFVVDASSPLRPAVVGASVTLTAYPQDIGGEFADASGTTAADGTFRTTFTASVGADTTFRITAAATASGYEGASASTSVLARMRGGAPEPVDNVPALDAITMVVVVAAAAFLFARHQARRRKP